MNGVLPDVSLRALIESGAISASHPILPEQIQPASLDLRLGTTAWRLRASFLCGKGRKVTVPDAVADSYISQGWVVPGSPAPAEQESFDISKLKVAELKAYADEHGIDLGEATKKADILTAIEAAVSTEEDADADADDGEAGAVPADADGDADS